MWAAVTLSCAGQSTELVGWWISTTITHPSPFFADTLGDDKHRQVTLFFGQSKEFVRLDHEGGCHMGTYLLQDAALVLTEFQEEPIAMGYTLRGEQLQLKSPDGFVFEFYRTSKNDFADPTPCPR